MRKKLLNTTVLYLTMLVLTMNVEAQTTKHESSPHVYNPFQARVPLWIDLSAGMNFADCYDNGTIPFSYIGLGYNVELGVTIEWGRYRLHPAFQMFDSKLKNPAGTANSYDASVEFLYQVFENANHNLHLWAGAILEGFFDSRTIPLLLNASNSISLFGNFGATGILQYDFAFNKAKNHPWLSTSCKLNVPLYGVVNRPGYSYIGNPTINQGTLEMLFGFSETFGKPFSGLNIDLCLFINLLNGNRIAFSYCWDYHTTGKKGIYRYDNAIHAINLSFMFRLN